MRTDSWTDITGIIVSFVNKHTRQKIYDIFADMSLVDGKFAELQIVILQVN
jgi:hypothetical protein